MAAVPMPRPPSLPGRLALCAVLLTTAPASAWDLPPDNGTLPAATVREILAGDDYPVTSGYSQRIEYIDFAANGRPFTQVVVILTPDTPRLHRGRKLVVVGGEPGSEYGMDFVSTVEGREGPGVWLAKRGVTFVALTRVGRWNFLAPSGDGSWAMVPIERRMPIFSRTQKAHWRETDYEVRRSGASAVTSASMSAVYRFPKKGTELEKQMLAATPRVFIEGYRLAIEKAIPDRAGAFVLFWGMSTGGASLYPLAKYYAPDGYLGWGTSSTGLAHLNNTTLGGNFDNIYDRMALRVRERGLDDFEFYTKTIDPDTRAQWWQAALQSPRFKSTEDAAMYFSAGALAEHGMRLWQSDLLPAVERAAGFAAFMQGMFETSFPPAELKKVAILDLNGTEDETLPPKTVDVNRTVMEPYARRFRVG
ncbi:MAG: hypothetical protein ACRD3C_21485, partial [Vicinamibacterales bacterium]